MLKIATSQFPVSNSITQNKVHILQQIEEASGQKADVIHFPEGSLSGYAGIDFTSFAGYSWTELHEAMKEVLHTAKGEQLWVILGSAHQLQKNKPFNSLYIIHPEGRIIDRYDKRFCAGSATEDDGDLLHYSPGSHFAYFTINGVACSVQICHDYRYPELYRTLKQNGTQLIFHSYHAGNMNPERQIYMESQVGFENHPHNPGRTYPEITMPATMISYAGNNHLWISASNTSAPQSCFGAFVVRPDGVINGRLTPNSPGLLYTTIDPKKEYYDSTSAWRGRSIDGVLHSGTAVNDPREEDRQTI